MYDFFYEAYKMEYQCSLFTFTDETQYRLRDPTTEKAMNCVLEDSLKRAQTKKLFEVQYSVAKSEKIYYRLSN